MVRFNTVIKRFDKQGEKTGWTYIEISAEIAAMLNPGVRTSYRVKGRLDDLVIEKQSLLPMGEGAFILPLNATLRKALKKQKGATVSVGLAVDNQVPVMNADLLSCLADEPAALKNFKALAGGHQRYFSKWIEEAKTAPTQSKRIAMAVSALARGWGFPEMLRAAKAENAARRL